MKTIDWIVIAFWVVGTSAFGIYFQRYVKSTRDYLLAGKRLRFHVSWLELVRSRGRSVLGAGTDANHPVVVHHLAILPSNEFCCGTAPGRVSRFVFVSRI